MKLSNQKKHHMQKFDKFNILPALGLSIGLFGLINTIFGGMNKMTGLFGGEESNKRLARDMMAGAIEGILEHFEWKIDDLKKDIERRDKQIIDLSEERDDYKEKYEGVLKKK